MAQTPTLDRLSHPSTLSVKDAIESRRSIRHFLQEPVNPDDLHEILRLTSLAPSANNTQTWRFAVVQNPDLQAQLQALAYNQAQVTSAPAVIMLYSDMDDTIGTLETIFHPSMNPEKALTRAESLRQKFLAKSPAERAEWANAQANIALGYLMIAARSLGYDTVPMLGFDQVGVKALLELPPHVQITAMVPLGKRAEEGSSHHRHSVERITRYY